MKAREYITSERFIHDLLIERAERAVLTLPNMWRRDKCLNPALFIWPTGTIPTDEGTSVNGLILVALPGDAANHRAFIAEALARVAGYAFMLVRNEGKALRVLLESPHGTMAWKYPLVRSADAQVLGRLTCEKDEEYLGLLWSPQQGRA